MNDIPYSNREIDEWRTDVKDKLDSILEQTKKTNGRVAALEIWRGVILGGLGVITAVIVPVALRIIFP